MLLVLPKTVLIFCCFVPLRMLETKRKELGDWANKLKSGLGKIDDTREKVEGKLRRAKFNIQRPRIIGMKYAVSF